MQIIQKIWAKTRKKNTRWELSKQRHAQGRKEQDTANTVAKGYHLITAGGKPFVIFVEDTGNTKRNLNQEEQQRRDLEKREKIGEEMRKEGILNAEEKENRIKRKNKKVKGKEKTITTNHLCQLNMIGRLTTGKLKAMRLRPIPGVLWMEYIWCGRTLYVASVYCPPPEKLQHPDGKRKDGKK